MGNTFYGELSRAIKDQDLHEVKTTLKKAESELKSSKDLYKLVNYVENDENGNTLLHRTLDHIIFLANLLSAESEAGAGTNRTRLQNLEDSVEIAKILINHPNIELSLLNVAKETVLHNLSSNASAFVFPRFQIITDLYRLLVSKMLHTQQENNSNLIEYPLPKPRGGLTAFMSCAKQVNVEGIKILLDSNAVSGSTQDASGNTVLHHLLNFDHNRGSLMSASGSLTEQYPLEILQDLLSSGCVSSSKNIRNFSGETPLHVAVKQDKVIVPTSIIAEFIASGDVKVNAKVAAHSGARPARISDTFNILCGMTPLFIVCAQFDRDRDDLVQVLLAAGAGKGKDRFFFGDEDNKEKEIHAKLKFAFGEIDSSNQLNEKAKEEMKQKIEVQAAKFLEQELGGGSSRTLANISKKGKTENDDDDDDIGEHEDDDELKGSKLSCFIGAVMKKKRKTVKLLLANGVKPIFTVRSVKKATVSECLMKYPEKSLFAILKNQFGWSMEAAKDVCGDEGDVQVDFVM